MSVPYFGWHEKTLADESQSKNDRVAVGLIGAGGMGLGNLRTASQWIDVVAIADADAVAVSHRPEDVQDVRRQQRG